MSSCKKTEIKTDFKLANKTKHKLSFKMLILIVIDMITILVSSIFSFLIANSEIVKNANALFQNFINSLFIFTLCVLLGLLLFRVYNKIWAYAGIQDFASCFFGVIAGSLCSLAIYKVSGLPVSAIYNTLTICTTLVLIICSRVAYKFIYYYIKYTKNHYGLRPRYKTLIVGGGLACKMLMLDIRSTDTDITPIGIVDDDLSKMGRTINGVKILGTTEDIPTICKKHNITHILFAIPSCSVADRKRILLICTKTGCTIKAVPSLHGLIQSESLLQQVRPIIIEDLLGRDTIKLNSEVLNPFIKNKICMVTGGGGSIGSELCRQLMKYAPKQIVILDIYENNAYDIQQELLHKENFGTDIVVEIASVCDYNKMECLFAKYHPDIVFHAAAHKHVPLMETNPEEAVKNNILGTYNIANLAALHKCQKFILISTDKAVNPTNVMGATKRCCEMIIQYFTQQTTSTGFAAVRLGNVLNSNGSVIPLFKKQIESGGPVTVTHPEVIRYFMTIPEAVSLILQAGAMAKGGEIFVLDMGNPVKIQKLAEDMIHMYGYKPGIDILIKYIGLRPGEKLYEELLLSEENLKETYNAKIFICNQLEIDTKLFQAQLKDVVSYANANNKEMVVNILRNMVPTFISTKDQLLVNTKTSKGQQKATYEEQS